MLGKEIPDGRTVTERHVVADVVAAFEQEPFFYSGRFVVDSLRLLDWNKIVGSVDDQERAANF